MKKINIYFFNRKSCSLKKQIQAIAKIAAKNDKTRPWLQFLQFEKLESFLRISATNGHVLSDILIDGEGLAFDTDLNTGEKVHIAAKNFLKIDQDFLKIQIEETATINSSIIAEILKNGFPDIEKVRIKTKLPVTLAINAALLRDLASTFENDVVELNFDPEFPSKAIFVSGKISSGLIMPVNQ